MNLCEFESSCKQDIFHFKTLYLTIKPVADTNTQVLVCTKRVAKQKIVGTYVNLNHHINRTSSITKHDIWPLNQLHIPTNRFWYLNSSLCTLYISLPCCASSNLMVQKILIAYHKVNQFSHIKLPILLPMNFCDKVRSMFTCSYGKNFSCKFRIYLYLFMHGELHKICIGNLLMWGLLRWMTQTKCNLTHIFSICLIIKKP